MNYKYTTTGVCSQEINFSIEEDNTIHAVEFVGGCAGNTTGVARLIEGMKVEDALSRIEGIKCGFKSTSCPDQLAQAIKQALTR